LTARRQVEARGDANAVGAAWHAGAAGERGDRARGEHDPANCIVISVRDVEVADTVERQATAAVEALKAATAVSAATAGCLAEARIGEKLLARSRLVRAIAVRVAQSAIDPIDCDTEARPSDRLVLATVA